MRKFYITYFLLAILCFSIVEGKVVRRAAFDFGSGKIKMQVADVDTESHQILQVIYTEATPVLLSEDSKSHPDYCFSEKIQQQAVDVAKGFKEKAIAHGAVEFCGIATEAYRKAPNGQKLADRYWNALAIPVSIISQQEEGKLGFTAVIVEGKLDPMKCVCWDIGGGSFQITFLDERGGMKFYYGPYGNSTTKNAVIRFVKNHDPIDTLSPNPINEDEWKIALEYFDAILPIPSQELLDKLRDKNVTLIGMDSHPLKLRNLSSYTTNDVLRFLQERLNKNDEELLQVHHNPPYAVTELVLISGIMSKLGVNKVQYVSTRSGSSSGLLVLEEYWPESVHESKETDI